MNNIRSQPNYFIAFGIKIIMILLFDITHVGILHITVPYRSQRSFRSTFH